MMSLHQAATKIESELHNFNHEYTARLIYTTNETNF